MNFFSVTGKTVLITGSSRGLGKTIASGFAQAGAKVVINGRDTDRLETAVSEFRSAEKHVLGKAFDVTVEDEVEDAIAEIESETGGIDVLINNAGIQRRGLLKDLSVEDWDAVIRGDLTSAFLVSRAAVRLMISKKHGSIINITSLMAEKARSTTGNYCAAKGGLKMLTKAMAAEWGDYGIRVNAIGPGYFLTDMTKPLTQDQQFDGWVKSEVPLGRWGNPEELIGTAIYLASDASSYVTGQTIYVDGGWFASL
ncbi:MAG: SDR family oxidoreductase [Spirochaetia bacterium]